MVLRLRISPGSARVAAPGSRRGSGPCSIFGHQLHHLARHLRLGRLDLDFLVQHREIGIANLIRPQQRVDSIMSRLLKCLTRNAASRVLLRSAECTMATRSVSISVLTNSTYDFDDFPPARGSNCGHTSADRSRSAAMRANIGSSAGSREKALPSSPYASTPSAVRSIARSGMAVGVCVDRCEPLTLAADATHLVPGHLRGPGLRALQRCRVTGVLGDAAQDEVDGVMII